MITSNANAQVKAIRKLRDRKDRQQSGLFFAEGLRITGEAIERGWEIETLVVAPELLVSDYGLQLVDGFHKHSGQVLEVSQEVFRSVSGKEGPQGIAAVVRQRWEALETLVPGIHDRWVALDSVADPGNLGTILRTHDAVGGQGVILLDQSTDPYDPSAIRASMGAVFSQRLVKASFEEFSAWKQRHHFPLIGTSDKADEDYHSFRYPSGLAVLMGSERHGLQPKHFALCDRVVRIPMIGRSDSLNLAVATAVVLYEVFNQQREQGLVSELH
ncbi:MAG TPA: RNA methyltransferase [Anaerolineaceae bacterium]|nr:RNA methyltransferase [Anaerolineaceae bacterium]